MDCGQLVLITLHNPREKFWGVLLSLTPAGERLELVSHFEYLGVTLTPRLRFTRNLLTRAAKASAGIGLLSRIRDVDLRTAMNVFRIKIRPTLTYGLEAFAHLLSLRNLDLLDSVKAAFLKEALGLHITTSNPFTFALAEELSMVEELGPNET